MKWNPRSMHGDDGIIIGWSRCKNGNFGALHFDFKIEALHGILIEEGQCTAKLRP